MKMTSMSLTTHTFLLPLLGTTTPQKTTLRKTVIPSSSPWTRTRILLAMMKVIFKSRVARTRSVLQLAALARRLKRWEKGSRMTWENPNACT
ncbi:hypothetical protein C8Q80DRAFT_1204496 [Daedaleopsis nitida]|nr:hypothetical protein C8Q80DRAFT_1204496 [Daedaleopsis nitida]